MRQKSEKIFNPLLYFAKKLKITKKEAISLLLILLVAAFLRFVNYQNRWGLAYDQARDLIVANYAINNFKIPLIGPFSSAGAFVYGPQWFWILMLFVFVSFGIVIVPWVILTILYIFTVFLMFIIGKEISGTRLGLIAALLTAISTLQIAQSTNLTSPSMVGVFSIISVYFFIKYVKDPKPLTAFLLGFFISNSINIHFQAIGLLSMVLISFIVTKKSIKNIFFQVLGLVIPFIPLLIFDLKTNFLETKNILDYYLHGQYKIFVPNRWLLYAGTYWPEMLGKIVGVYRIGGYIIIGLLAFFILESTIRRKISRGMVAVVMSFLIIFLMLRYYRGERFDSYVVFTHPFILLLSSYVLLRIYEWRKVIGITLFVLVILGSMRNNIPEILNATNYTDRNTKNLKSMLLKIYPDKKFAVYDYKFKHAPQSYSLVMYMNKDKLSDDGLKIGVVIASPASTFKDFYPLVYGEPGGYHLYNLSSSTSAQLSEAGWAFVNPNAIYGSIEEWYKK